jgi:hypothetical protein
MNNYIDQLSSMGMNKRHGHVSPHKAVMMLWREQRLRFACA